MALHDKVTVLIDVGAGAVRAEDVVATLHGGSIDVVADTDPATFTEVDRKGLAVRTVAVAHSRLVAYIEEPHRARQS